MTGLPAQTRRGFSHWLIAAAVALAAFLPLAAWRAGHEQSAAAAQLSPAAQPLPTPPVPARFAWVDVFLDTGDRPLAAYQVHIAAADAGENGPKVVGIEGGEHPAFSEPPYYDPEAMMGERIILAALSTLPHDDLPRGRVRIARVHVRNPPGDAEPRWTASMQAAAAPGGEPIDATVTLVPGARK